MLHLDQFQTRANRVWNYTVKKLLCVVFRYHVITSDNIF